MNYSHTNLTKWPAACFDIRIYHALVVYFSDYLCVCVAMDAVSVAEFCACQHALLKQHGVLTSVESPEVLMGSPADVVLSLFAALARSKLCLQGSRVRIVKKL